MKKIDYERLDLKASCRKIVREFRTKSSIWKFFDEFKYKLTM